MAYFLVSAHCIDGYWTTGCLVAGNRLLWTEYGMLLSQSCVDQVFEFDCLFVTEAVKPAWKCWLWELLRCVGLRCDIINFPHV